MAKIKLNGKITKLRSKTSILKLLKTHKLEKKKIAIELNGKILQKSNYNKTILKNMDTLEIVHFIGGG